MDAVRIAIATLLLMAGTGAARAEVLRYTENAGGDGTIALGYPIPLPLDTQEATDGFRTYDALMAHLQDLALGSDDLSARAIGTTLAGRTIWAYTAGDADSTTSDGRPESSVVVDGGIHAREWASPEVVAGTLERLLAPETQPGVDRYLLDTQSAVLIPVLNVDGFLQTQRYPDQVLRTEFSGDPPDWPRDGRMQRKNMRDKDEILCAADDPACVVHDGMNGVDANRNHLPFWGSLLDSSSDPRSLVYRGTAAASENESQALYEAARGAPEDRLRMYVDVHTFSRTLAGVETGEARHDAIEQRLGLRLRAVTGNRYAYSAVGAGSGIGSTDEYFANTYKIPGYTLELEPGPNGAVEYGGFGNDHDGFVLPASQIARVRNEISTALILGFYCSAGPPSVQRVEVREAAGGRVVYSGAWVVEGAARRFDVAVRETLAAGTDYALRVVFDKPMRVRDGAGAVAQYLGQSIALAPQVALEGLDRDGHAFSMDLAPSASAWRATPGAAAGFGRYADDAIVIPFRPPASLPLDGAKRVDFAIGAVDLCGQALDADPATPVDWANGSWTGYENSNGTLGDAGGTDRAARVVDDGSPLFSGSSDDGGGGGGGGGGAFGWTSLAVLLAAAWARRRCRAHRLRRSAGGFDGQRHRSRRSPIIAAPPNQRISP